MAMKRGVSFWILFLVFANILAGGQTKIINKNFKAEPDKTIEFENFSGLKVKITAWDKNEIGISLKAQVDCSDNEYETLYINSLDVSSAILGSRQIISFEKTSEEAGSSIFGLFKVKLFFHFNSEIKGEIFLPKDIAVNLDFNYSDMVLSGLNSLQEVKGRSNNITLYNCMRLTEINNDYGKIKLEKCSGKLEIRSRSTTIEIFDHKGDLKIQSDYTDIRINNVDGKISLRDRSGDIEIKNAVVEFLDIPYSDLEIRDMTTNVENTLKIRGKSSSYSFYNVKSNFEIESDYTNVRFRNTGGRLLFDGKSCKITGDDVTGNLEIRTQYSTIDFQNLSAKSIKVSKMNNNIDLRLLNEPEQVDITNKYGNIELTIPRSYDGEINLGTRYGKIKSDFELDIKTEKSDTFGYSKGKTAKKKISIDNYSSDISLRY